MANVTQSATRPAATESGIARRLTQIDIDEDLAKRRERRKQRKTLFSLCAHVQTCLPYLREFAGSAGKCLSFRICCGATA